MESEGIEEWEGPEFLRSYSIGPSCLMPNLPTKNMMGPCLSFSSYTP